MKIAHLSDLHIGTEDPRLVLGLCDAVRQIAPDAIVATGDFTQSGRLDEFRRAGELMDSFGVPIVATPGNHDVPVFSLMQRIWRPWARYQRFIGTHAKATLVNQRCAILTLNTARAWAPSMNWSHGSLSESQIQRAESFFSKHQDKPVRLLGIHHPFHIPEDMVKFRPVRRWEKMLDVLAQNKVHGVLSGHIHRHSVSSVVAQGSDGPWTVTLMQAGSPTSARNRESRHAFGVIEIGDCEMRTSSHRWNGDKFVEDDSNNRDLSEHTPESTQQIQSSSRTRSKAVRQFHGPQAFGESNSRSASS